VKTLLRIEQAECQRCNHRWTSSTLTNEFGFPVGAVEVGLTAPFPAPAGFYVVDTKPPACFNCSWQLPATVPTWGTKPTRHPSHDEPKRPKAAGSPLSVTPVSDADLLGDL
jgi:hypothetical protein